MSIDIYTLANLPKVTIADQVQPDIPTIIWRYYFRAYNNAGMASNAANEYLKQAVGMEFRFF